MIMMTIIIIIMVIIIIIIIIIIVISATVQIELRHSSENYPNFSISDHHPHSVPHILFGPPEGTSRCGSLAWKFSG